MNQEIRPEDLIVTEQDGTRRINHDVIESYGLFNLPKATMRQALMVYYDNASRQGRGAAQTVRTFITLASAITLHGVTPGEPLGGQQRGQRFAEKNRAALLCDPPHFPRPSASVFQSVRRIRSMDTAWRPSVVMRTAWSWASPVATS